MARRLCLFVALALASIQGVSAAPASIRSLAADVECEGCSVSYGMPGSAAGACGESVGITIASGSASGGTCAYSEQAGDCLTSSCSATIVRSCANLPDDHEMQFCRKTLGSPDPRLCDDPPPTTGSQGSGGSSERVERVECKTSGNTSVRFSIATDDCNGGTPTAYFQVACSQCAQVGGGG